jgi:site-specific DNA-cytosine methylase
MTEEDFINNLEFRAYIKSLKNTFPFVVGYRFPENFEEKLQSYSSIVPIHLVVSLSKILEQYPNWKPMWYVPSYIDKDGYYDGIYFSSAFETDENKEQKLANSMTASMHKGVGNDGMTLINQTKKAGGQGGKTGLYQIKEATKKGYAEAGVGDSINLSVPNSKTRRGRVGKGIAQTLDTGIQQHTLTENMQIRRLTPKECERLQGFPDNYTKDFSDTQRYKMMGNAVTVNVVEYIISKMFQEKTEQCFCKSYYDDDKIIKDCTCGKCI